MAQVEVITGADRRRSFTLEEIQRLLAEALAPGVNVKAFCRRRDIASSSLYTWRRELARLEPPVGRRLCAGVRDGDRKPVRPNAGERSSSGSRVAGFGMAIAGNGANAFVIHGAGRSLRASGN